MILNIYRRTKENSLWLNITRMTQHNEELSNSIVNKMLDIIQRPVFYLKYNVSETYSVFVLSWYLLRWAKSTDIVRVSGRSR
jgi:hypothetical protein